MKEVEKHWEEEKEKILKIFLEDINAMVFVREIDSVSGEMFDIENTVEDQEAIIVIDGKWDREDLKDILGRIANVN